MLFAYSPVTVGSPTTSFTVQQSNSSQLTGTVINGGVVMALAPPAALLNNSGAVSLQLQQQQPQHLCMASATPIITPCTPCKVAKSSSLQFDDKIHIMRDGRYVPDDILGSGTYGQVVRCLDRSSNCFVAVKIAHRDAAYRRSALSEAQVLQLLSGSPDVVRILDFFEENGRVCIATELLCKNLYEVQKERGFESLPLHQVRSIALSLLRALSSLHQVGYMHCDVKPENVMLRRHDLSESCLIDFGAVRALHENHYYDVQSLWYRAPEVVCGVPYSVKIDSWGVGCLLYELHTGSPLVPGENPQDQLKRMLQTIGSLPVEYLLNGVNMPRLSFSSQQQLGQPDSTRLYHTLRHSMRHCSSSSDEEAHHFADLITRLLHPDANQRLSCTDALTHPFFCHGSTMAPMLPYYTTLEVPPLLSPRSGVSPTPSCDNLLSCNSLIASYSDFSTLSAGGITAASVATPRMAPCPQPHPSLNHQCGGYWTNTQTGGSPFELNPSFNIGDPATLLGSQPSTPQHTTMTSHHHQHHQQQNVPQQHRSAGYPAAAVNGSSTHVPPCQLMSNGPPYSQLQYSTPGCHPMLSSTPMTVRVGNGNLVRAATNYSAARVSPAKLQFPAYHQQQQQQQPPAQLSTPTCGLAMQQHGSSTPFHTGSAQSPPLMNGYELFWGGSPYFSAESIVAQ